ncbi:MAG: hypothetical protein ACLP6E_00925 [Acidimicrobiales bacterium]
MAASIMHGEIAVLPALVVGVIVAAISLLVGPDRGDIRVDIALASMASFLFGALLAFTIVRTRERLAKVHDLIAKGHAYLLSIYQIMAVFGEEERDRTRRLIDAHLIDQIDYRLVDYHAATASHDRLVEEVYALEPKTPQEEGVYRELVQLCVQLGQDRVLIEAATGQAMSPIEWSGLLLLLLVLLALIAVLPGGTVPGAIVAGVLAAALVTLIVLLRMLDLLRWHERVTIWEPTSRLFRSMGRDPYVPREVIENGRFQPTGRIRVVDYADPYPIRTTKTITVEDFTPLSANGSSGSRSRSVSSPS